MKPALLNPPGDVLRVEEDLTFAVLIQREETLESSVTFS